MLQWLTTDEALLKVRQESQLKFRFLFCQKNLIAKRQDIYFLSTPHLSLIFCWCCAIARVKSGLLGALQFQISLFLALFFIPLSVTINLEAQHSPHFHLLFCEFSPQISTVCRPFYTPEITSQPLEQPCSSLYYDSLNEFKENASSLFRPLFKGKLSGFKDFKV